MKCSLSISDFLQETSRLSLVFLYFFALITEECFHICLCSSLELCIQMGISFLFSFTFRFPFLGIYKASSDNHVAFLYLFFLGRVLITDSCTVSQTSPHSSSDNLKVWIRIQTRFTTAVINRALNPSFISFSFSPLAIYLLKKKHLRVASIYRRCLKLLRTDETTHEVYYLEKRIFTI